PEPPLLEAERRESPLDLLIQRVRECRRDLWLLGSEQQRDLGHLGVPAVDRLARKRGVDRVGRGGGLGVDRFVVKLWHYRPSGASPSCDTAVCPRSTR